MRLGIFLPVLAVILALPVVAMAQSLPDQTAVTVDGQSVSATNQVQAVGKTLATLGSDTIDVVGDTSGGSSGAGRAKGNSYRVDTSVVLNDAEFYLTFSDTQTLTYYVFESSVEFGTYTEIHRNSQSVTGTGTAWYSSGPLSVPLAAGMHYIIAVSWTGTTGYFYGVGDTQATSFGAYVHGYATGYDPLPSSFSSTSNDQAIYHQRITTDVGTFALAVSPDPLVGGSTGTFSATNGDANTNTYLAYSMAGPGSTFVPFLNVTIDLAAPKQAGGVVTSDGQGNATWNLPIPAGAVGRNVWVQAVQYGKKTNVVATSVI